MLVSICDALILASTSSPLGSPLTGAVLGQVLLSKRTGALAVRVLACFKSVPKHLQWFIEEKLTPVHGNVLVGSCAESSQSSGKHGQHAGDGRHASGRRHHRKRKQMLLLCK